MMAPELRKSFPEHRLDDEVKSRGELQRLANK